MSQWKSPGEGKVDQDHEVEEDHGQSRRPQRHWQTRKPRQSRKTRRPPGDAGGDRDHNSIAGDHVGGGGTGNTGNTMMALEAMKKRQPSWL